MNELDGYFKEIDLNGECVICKYVYKDANSELISCEYGKHGFPKAKKCYGFEPKEMDE